MLELLTDNSQNKFLMYQEKLEEALMANEIDTSKYVVLDGRGYRTKTDAQDTARIRYPGQPNVTVRRFGDLWYVVQRKEETAKLPDSN